MLSNTYSASVLRLQFSGQPHYYSSASHTNTILLREFDKKQMAIKSFAYAAWHYHVYSGNLRKFYRLLIEVAAAKAIKPTITNAKFSWHLQQIRCAHQIPRPVPKPNSPRRQANPTIKREPSYEITFTCTPCGHRSSHSITKQGYHCGSVLIACPGCKNRHIISDHLDVCAKYRSISIFPSNRLENLPILTWRGVDIRESEDHC